DRDRDAFSADDALAVAQRRDRIEEAPSAFRHCRAHARLVAVVVQAHRDDRAALRQHALREVRRTLGDQAEADAILTAFLGNPFEDSAHGLPVFLGIVLRNVTVGLFANE